jgi:hypothetical protein
VIIIPGLGELQTTDEIRIKSWQKGYTAGQPDLILLKHTSEHCGLVIKMKTPKNTRPSSHTQTEGVLAELMKFQTVVSNC